MRRLWEMCECFKNVTCNKLIENWSIPSVNRNSSFVTGPNRVNLALEGFICALLITKKLNNIAEYNTKMK